MTDERVEIIRLALKATGGHGTYHYDDGDLGIWVPSTQHWIRKSMEDWKSFLIEKGLL